MSRPLWLAWMLLEEICFRAILNDMQLLVVWQSLATRVRTQMNAARTKGEPVQGFNYSTTTLLNRYLKVWLSCTVLFPGLVTFHSELQQGHVVVTMAAHLTFAKNIHLVISSAVQTSVLHQFLCGQCSSLSHLKCILVLHSMLISVFNALSSQCSQSSTSFQHDHCTEYY